MKIISYGNIKPKRLTCPSCEAVFEYERTDEKRGRHIPLENEGMNAVYYVCCPACLRRIETREERWL